MFYYAAICVRRSRCSQPLMTERSRMAEKVPILVVLGIDIDGKPHASRFDRTRRAACSSRRRADGVSRGPRRPLTTTNCTASPKRLPLGKIFATGRAFVPFVSRSAFDKLATLVEGGVTIEAAGRGRSRAGLSARRHVHDRSGQHRRRAVGEDRRRHRRARRAAGGLGPGLVGGHRRRRRWRQPHTALDG